MQVSEKTGRKGTHSRDREAGQANSPSCNVDIEEIEALVEDLLNGGEGGLPGWASWGCPTQQDVDYIPYAATTSVQA